MSTNQKYPRWHFYPRNYVMSVTKLSNYLPCVLQLWKCFFSSGRSEDVLKKLTKTMNLIVPRQSATLLQLHVCPAKWGRGRGNRVLDHHSGVWTSIIIIILHNKHHYSTVSDDNSKFSIMMMMVAIMIVITLPWLQTSHQDLQLLSRGWSRKAQWIAWHWQKQVSWHLPRDPPMKNCFPQISYFG